MGCHRYAGELQLFKTLRVLQCTFKVWGCVLMSPPEHYLPGLQGALCTVSLALLWALLDGLL
jgi:hypothetical protein